MKKVITCLSLAAALSLTGCATTPSKPLTFDQLGQYNTVPLNAQTYRVSFVARPNFSFGTAEEITLVKSAQTALQNGFQFFKVVDDPSNRNQQPPRQAVVYPTPMYPPYGYYRRYPGFWPDPFYDMPQVVNIDPVQVSYTIECYKTQKTAPDDAFDARLILQSLGQKYGVSPTGQVLQPQPVTVPSAK
ncbi:CC0125/CC1285 family lipoprotein [Acinetobacter sp. WCHAc010052]|jgi:hypothetical protein|uniref:CC0125/CC1285 family lipoprotein n=1 Tax=Acinetobacter sp. WCHAc010052 TaxID=2004647 RepID=UPI000B3C6E20|nr:hypothetical protein [Acinetobacter sp. WCHAc010052]AXY58737.1 hypothetical protein CDG61_00980 [Acinetobacter sp. WCHAc010052]